MRRRDWVVTIAMSVLIFVAAFGQGAGVAEPYDVDEAYKVYSVLVPGEESAQFAKGTLVIQQETVPEKLTPDCVTNEAASEFKDAIADYERVNKTRWALQRKFDIEKPYEIVSSDAIKVFFQKEQRGWDAFYERYPGSGGYVIVSAVGFNKDKTKAIVYSGSSCHWLCGAWSFHLLKKVDGKWKPARGVTCASMS